VKSATSFDMKEFSGGFDRTRRAGYDRDSIADGFPNVGQ
jgi:hypothetical protein